MTQQQQLSPEQVAAYHQDGYLILPRFLSEEEVDKLYHIATDDDTMSKHSYDVNDSTGKKSKLGPVVHPRQRCLRPAEPQPAHGGGG